jgi:serine/threonine-protein kinase
MQADDLAEIGQHVGLGSVLGGKYRIDRVIGVGGMGAVVAAHHVQLGEPVAIKFLLPRAVGMSRHAARFLREARAINRLKSSHVARVLDVDVRPDGTPFIVMEYLTGETMAAQLAREQPPVEELVDEVLEAAEAVAEAHSLGIVHRDLKPANLFLARGPGNIATVKVLDFGISKLLEGDPGSHESTTGEAPVGSPPYMSPEQFTRPSEVDARTDLWSLGVVLYQGLGGRSPFSAETFGAVCALVLQRHPAPLEELRPELPDGLGAVVERALRKNRDERWSDIRELARALAPYGTERARRALAVIEAISLPRALPAHNPEPAAAPLLAVDTGTLTAATDGVGAGAASEDTSPRSTRVWLLASAVAVLLAALGWLVLRAGNGNVHALAPSATAPGQRAESPAVAESVSAESSGRPVAPGSVTTASAARAVASAAQKARKQASYAGLKPTPALSVNQPQKTFDPVYQDRK